MWRYQSFPEIHDSDQSISDGDDEELHPNSSENYVSLAGTSGHNKFSFTKHKIDTLPGFGKFPSGKEETIRDTNDLGFSSEDEVEVPDFHKRNLDFKNIRCDPTNSKADDSIRDSNDRIIGVKKGLKMLVESIPDEKKDVFEAYDLYPKEQEKQFKPCASSGVHKEFERQNHLLENARWPMHYSEVKIPGRKCKTKQISSSQLLHKQGVSWPVWKDIEANSVSDDELLDEAEASELWPEDKNCPVLLGDNGEATKSSFALPMEPALPQDSHKHSMAERLDNLQGKIRNPSFNLKKRTDIVQSRRRKGLVQHPVIKSMSSSGNISTSDEDPCELMHGETSTEDEDNAKDSEIVVVESGRKTMADKFQEAFGSASTDNRRPSLGLPKHSRTGLFGRLQNIMQEQKEQDAEFMKKVQTEVWPKDEAECIDVKILSRSFDAKLIVCQCCLLENEESSLQNPQQENFGKIWTVIFNTRVCGDVDLEVGNLVRISPPWKEVQTLQGGEIVILTSYFSQIHT